MGGFCGGGATEYTCMLNFHDSIGVYKDVFQKQNCFLSSESEIVWSLVNSTSSEVASLANLQDLYTLIPSKTFRRMGGASELFYLPCIPLINGKGFPPKTYIVSPPNFFFLCGMTWRIQKCGQNCARMPNFGEKAAEVGVWGLTWNSLRM